MRTDAGSLPGTARPDSGFHLTYYASSTETLTCPGHAEPPAHRADDPYGHP